ncbi:hypothetical protein [Halococcus saccharolyticus]|uniref:hypothetical protein n=1 Tax=Halococcus saccharolyticus TaxID=62319 RepID=UPI001266F54B|nr:hypothetical protein [Halococcus saccharolyticus]
MSNHPLEETLVIAAHTQMRNEFNDIQSIATSGKEESEVGFDITVPEVKQLCLQYKRPKILKTGGYKFKIDETQRDTLQKFSNNAPSQIKSKHTDTLDNPFVYYAFPLIEVHEHLPVTLQRLLLVEVDEVKPNTSLIYVPDPGKPVLTAGTPKPDVDPTSDLDARVNGEKEPNSIDLSGVWSWSEFRDELTNCRIGLGLNVQPSTEYTEDDPHYQGQATVPENSGPTTTIIGDRRFKI